MALRWATYTTGTGGRIDLGFRQDLSLTEWRELGRLGQALRPFSDPTAIADFLAERVFASWMGREEPFTREGVRALLRDTDFLLWALREVLDVAHECLAQFPVARA